MKKVTLFLLSLIAMSTIAGSSYAETKYTYTYVTPKAPQITASLKPSIQKYNEGNYTGALLDLKALTEKEKNNAYAKYYLGLTYMQLGYSEEATQAFKEVIEKGGNATLTYYSERAVMCIAVPTQEVCNPPKYVSTNRNKKTAFVDDENEQAIGNEVKKEESDIDKFIRSGKKIHPAAMDLIIKQRMEIKLQQDEYNNKQNEQLGPLSYNRPTEEEIAHALDTLSRIGINPFEEGYMLSSIHHGFNYADSFDTIPLNYGNKNPDIAQMLLYNQISQQKNDFINYGI